MESTDESQGKAVPFVIYSNKKFIVTDEAKEVLCSKEYKNIGIISLVGKYRTGKSFLLNRVLLNQKKENGFDVGPTIRPCTKGIWMWSKPIYIENNHCKEKFPVFMIDTEGLGAYDEEINHDSKIFLIAILISSLFIFNSFGNIDENSINSLSFILNLSKTIKLKETSENSFGGNDKNETAELAGYFPSLLWLLRDFSLKLEDTEGNTITAKQYLENALQLQKGTSEVVEEKNKVRKMIQSYFSERDCFSMVRPVEDEKDLQNLQTLDNSKIRTEFLDQAETLRNKVSKKVRPKLFNNKHLNGSMLTELLKSILESINQGLIPVIESSWKYVMHNESIKNMNEVLKQYIFSINLYKEENKENPNFFKDLGVYNKSLEKKLVEEYQKSTVMDEASANEYLTKIESKFKEEFKKFNDENSKFFENRMTESLEKNTKKIIDTFETDKYAKNYYQFFQDLENLKEITEATTPDFPLKKEIIFEKIIHIVKKFIEMTFLKNKIMSDKELVTVKNEFESVSNKLNMKTVEYDTLKTETKQAIDKLNNQIVNLKMSEKNLEEKVKLIENEKKTLIETDQKKINDLKKEMEETCEKLKKEKDKINNELKSKDDQILKLKFTEEKMTSLNTLKTQFYDKEISDQKERNDTFKKEASEYKSAIDELNAKIDGLKEENNKKQIQHLELERKLSQGPSAVGSSISNPYASTNNPYGSNVENNNIECESPFKQNRMSNSNININSNQNNELVTLLNTQVESSKSQVEDTKKIFEMLTSLKIDLNANYEIRCSKLEAKISEIKLTKKIIKSSSTLQCKFCAKLFTFDLFLVHTKTCQTEIISSNSNHTTNINNKQIPDKLKIKILKGILNKDELGKPYIEYIIEIIYNTQSWRVNKKFNGFANLHKTLKALFNAEVKFPESSSIFSKINMNGKDSNNYHENKIKYLEKYIKDIADIGIINKSKPFRKFFDFEDYIDEDGTIRGTVKNINPLAISEEDVKVRNLTENSECSNYSLEGIEENKQTGDGDKQEDKELTLNNLEKKTEDNEKTREIIYKKKKSSLERKNVNIGSINKDKIIKDDKKKSSLSSLHPISKIQNKTTQGGLNSSLTYKEKNKDIDTRFSSSFSDMNMKDTTKIKSSSAKKV